MERKIMLIGIVAIAAIVAMVLVVENTLSGMLTYTEDFYVRPSGMQFRVESGVVLLQSEVVVSQACRNAVFCAGKASYACCNHDGTECNLPTKAQEFSGSCPLTHRSRCQCREDYIAGLVERYG